jgi:LUD domain
VYCCGSNYYSNPRQLTVALSIAAQPIASLNRDFGHAADAATIERTEESLRRRGFKVQVAADTADARQRILALIPEGAQVGQGASKTLDEIGVTAEIETSGRYDAIRPRTRAMDRATQGTEIRKLGASPDVMLSSVHAVTVDGTIVIASYGGSQLGPIVSGAGKVILVVGSQKIVPDLETGLRRIEEYCYPLESARLEAALGVPSKINKVLILNGEGAAQRVDIVLIPESVGF